jgi:ABC-2 type transport system ATP-binding protein
MLVFRRSVAASWVYAACDCGRARHGTEAAMDDNRFDGMAGVLGVSKARRGALGLLAALSNGLAVGGAEPGDARKGRGEDPLRGHPAATSPTASPSASTGSRTPTAAAASSTAPVPTAARSAARGSAASRAARAPSVAPISRATPSAATASACCRGAPAPTTTAQRPAPSGARRVAADPATAPTSRQAATTVAPVASPAFPPRRASMEPVADGCYGSDVARRLLYGFREGEAASTRTAPTGPESRRSLGSRASRPLSPLSPL